MRRSERHEGVTERAQDEESCPDCGGDLDPTSDQGGQLVCEDCGLVVDEQRVDQGPEWRSFDDGGQSKSRVGPGKTATQQDSGLGTQIGKGEPNVRGEKQAKLEREHRRAKVSGSSDQLREEGLQKIGGVMTSNPHCDPTDTETAARIFKTAANDLRVLDGRSLEEVCGASIFIAVKVSGKPLQLSDIASGLQGTDESRILKVAHIISQSPSKLPGKNNDSTQLPQPPEIFVDRVSGSLEGVTAGLREPARELIEVLKDENLVSGKKPIGIAAAAVYAAGVKSDLEDAPSQRAVAEVAGVSTDTISDRFREIREVLKRHGRWDVS